MTEVSGTAQGGAPAKPGPAGEGTAGSEAGRRADSKERVERLSKEASLGELIWKNHRNAIAVVEGKATYLLTTALSIVGLTVLLHLRLSFFGIDLSVGYSPTATGWASAMFLLLILYISIIAAWRCMRVLKVRKILVTGILPGALLRKTGSDEYSSEDLLLHALEVYLAVNRNAIAILDAKTEDVKEAQYALVWLMSSFLAMFVFSATAALLR